MTEGWQERFLIRCLGHTFSQARQHVYRRPSHSAAFTKCLLHAVVQITACAVRVSTEEEASPPGKERSDCTWACFLLGEGNPTPVLLPGKSHGQRGLMGCSPWGR